MRKVIFSLVFVFIWCSLAEAQSQTINTTLADIKNFQIQSLNGLTGRFNVLRDEIYGHFFRSQSTLRLSRQAIYAGLSRYPFHSLTNETRDSFKKNVSAILTDCADPTIDYIQKEAMNPLFNFSDLSPIEKSFENITIQLNELSSEVNKTTNATCLSRVLVLRRLPGVYNPLINAIINCTRVVTGFFRGPIIDLIGVNLLAQPVLIRAASDIDRCAFSFNREECVKTLLKTLCVESTCQTCGVIKVVRTQAEGMMNNATKVFNDCLTDAQKKLPASAPFLDEVKNCQNATIASDFELAEEPNYLAGEPTDLVKNEVFEEIIDY